MKNSYEFKIKCVEAYMGLGTLEIPKGVNLTHFTNNIREWVRIYDQNDPNELKHNYQNKRWTVEERIKIVAMVMAGNSIITTAIKTMRSNISVYNVSCMRMGYLANG